MTNTLAHTFNICEKNHNSYTTLNKKMKDAGCPKISSRYDAKPNNTTIAKRSPF